ERLCGSVEREQHVAEIVVSGGLIGPQRSRLHQERRRLLVTALGSADDPEQIEGRKVLGLNPEDLAAEPFRLRAVAAAETCLRLRKNSRECRSFSAHMSHDSRIPPLRTLTARA